MPLITNDGYALGTLCVVDFEPRELAFAQKESMRRLAHQVMGQLEHRRKLIELDELNQDLDRARASIVAEKERAEALLTNILPQSIAEELKARGKVEPRYFPSASILFTDFKDFTKFAERAEPAMLVGLLDQYFSSFDEIVTRHGLEKLKTIGDAFMAVGGVPLENRQHAVDTCLAALEIRTSVARTNRQREKMRLPALEVRIGIHSGSLMAGVVGRRKFTYDVWGDSVNVAARLEKNGEAGRINVSDSVYNVVKPLFDLDQRGTIEMKNKAAIPMYFLDRIKAKFSKDSEGSIPNEDFLAERKRAVTGFSPAGRIAQ
jgi:class 3 adenylate cyclase